jgi:hypothetical protein
MSTDYGEKERAFIDGLKEATGRDLAEWMAALAAQNLTERNDIILWLRRQGFMFAKASWLERIHHNAGKPIYAESAESPPRRESRTRAPRDIGPPASTPSDAPSPAPPATAPDAVPARPKLALVPKVAAPVEIKSEPAAAEAAQPPPPPAAAMPASADIEPLLAKAKAYRPLAQHIIAQIRGVRPAATLLPSETYLTIADPAEFARLGVGAKELRLHLALGERGFDQVVQKGAAGGGLGKGDALTHMIVLTDARQVDKRLLDLVAEAAAHVNG